jgi:hypothetical protein
MGIRKHKQHGSQRVRIVVVDQFSKQTILIPTRKSANTAEVYDLLWERVFAIFGIPERMTSDRDKIFWQDGKLAKSNERNRYDGDFSNSVSSTNRWSNRTENTGTSSIFSSIYGLPTNELVGYLSVGTVRHK